MKHLTIYAHSRDCNTIEVQDENGRELLECVGYVPRHMQIGGGDCISLKIDIETGRIVDWDVDKVKARIAEMIEEKQDDRS